MRRIKLPKLVSLTDGFRLRAWWQYILRTQPPKPVERKTK